MTYHLKYLDNVEKKKIEIPIRVLLKWLEENKQLIGPNEYEKDYVDIDKLSIFLLKFVKD